jgi:polysaccharide pyruvyl transferase WcaK-like protein
VGDPALLIEGFDDGHRRPDERLIGVNLGFGSDLWMHDEDRVVKEVSTALRTLVRRHQFRVLFLVVNDADSHYAHDCRDQAELAQDECPIVRALDADSYMVAITECWIMISQRLHAGILAAAAGIPGIMLEYQPKCRDFMESVAQPQWSIRTDQLDAARLVDLATDLSENRQQQAKILNASVAELRQRLREEIARLGEMTGQSGHRRTGDC